MTASVCLFAGCNAFGELPGVRGDGVTNDTDALQAVLNAGGQINIPAGTYLVGSLTIPANTTLKFAPQAVLKIAIERITNKKFLTLGGDHITIEGISFDLKLADGKIVHNKQLDALIFAQNVGNVTIRGMRAIGTAEPEGGGHVNAISTAKCRDFTITESQVAFIQHMLTAINCERFTISNNRGENGKTLTHWRDSSRGLIHTGNWSSNVKDQCLWWGGDSNDNHSWIPKNTANIVQRDIRPGDQGYSAHTSGTYDVMVHNNYAEYGNTLAWGSKGRNIIITSNVARFMTDMAYDTEGGENVIISNNISINSKAAGIGCYFWSQKIVITGNLIQIIPEGDEKYQGHFLRLHGPGSADHFGTGEALITGNLFVNDTTKAKRLSIEACRDVVIQNNKFMNGGISTINSSRFVTITNNTFDSSLAEDFSCVNIAQGTLETTISNNIIKRIAAKDTVAPTKAAIAIAARPGALRIINDNQIRGWPAAINAETNDASNGIRRLIVRGNLVEGSITVPRDATRWTTLVADNIDIKTMKTEIQYKEPNK